MTDFTAEGPADTLSIYRTTRRSKLTLKAKSEWRWRYRAAGNNAIMATGGEGYERVEACTTAAFRVVGIKEEDDMTNVVSGTYHRHHGLPSVWVTVTG